MRFARDQATAHLAADDIPMTPVVESVVKAVEQEGERVDVIVLLQSMTPLLMSMAPLTS